MKENKQYLAVVGIGANLGDAANTVYQAATYLQTNPATMNWRISHQYQTAPIGVYSRQPDYINAVASFETKLGAEDLMFWLLDVELRFGRRRFPLEERNSARVLDLDLLLYDQFIIKSDHLIVPHPRLHERAFVLKPLLEILPRMQAPGLGILDEFLAKVADQKIKCLENEIMSLSSECI